MPEGMGVRTMCANKVRSLLVCIGNDPVPCQNSAIAPDQALC